MSERFRLKNVEPVQLAGPCELLDKRLMSPFVWRGTDGSLSLLVRAAPQRDGDDKVTGCIWYGRGELGGLDFSMDDQSLIAPGPDGLDICGCEDPTVVPTAQGCVVYYTGLDSDRSGQLLYVSGDDIRSIQKRGVALASDKTEKNTKEATVECTGDGKWRLLYEFSANGKSQIGLAVGEGPAMPWTEQPEPFIARPDNWDSWHLSTGPLLMTDPDAPVMFYNGATENAHWGIGWVILSRDCMTVVERCADPVIAPPTQSPHDKDVSFAASAIESEGTIWLYFTRNDRELRRATIERV